MAPGTKGIEFSIVVQNENVKMDGEEIEKRLKKQKDIL